MPRYPDDFQLQRKDAYLSAAASSASRAAAYAAGATRTANVPFHTTVADLSSIGGNTWISMFANILWWISLRLLFPVAVFCLFTFFCFWLSYENQEWIDQRLFEWGMIWHPIHWPVDAMRYWVDVIIGLCLSVLQSIFWMIRQAIDLLFTGLNEVYCLVVNLIGTPFKNWLDDQIAEIEETFRHIGRLRHARRAQHRFRRFSRTVLVYTIPFVIFAWAMLWIRDAVTPVPELPEPEVHRFHVPEWMIRTQNRPQEGSSHKSVYGYPVESDAEPKAKRGWFKSFFGKDDGQDVFPSYSESVAEDDFASIEVDKVWASEPEHDVQEPLEEILSEVEMNDLEQSEAASHGSVSEPASHLEETTITVIVNDLHPTGDITQTPQKMAVTSPVVDIMPPPEEDQHSTESHEHSTSQSHEHEHEHSISIHQHKSSRRITSKYNPYRPSTSRPQSSAMNALEEAASSASVAAAHDQRRCVLGDKMVYCRTCRQRHCCELPYR